MKTSMILVMVLGLAFSTFARAEETQAPDLRGIPNAEVLAPGVVNGGKPSDEGLVNLKNKGFRTVIDTRMPEEGTEEERKRVEGLGMTYVNIPMASRQATPAQAETLGELLQKDETYPVLLHCASGARSRVLWEAHQAELPQ